MLEDAYEIKTLIICADGDKIAKVLNRVITCTGFGFELEADQRHSETIAQQLGVSSSGGITTAGCQNEDIECPEQEQLLLPLGPTTSVRIDLTCCTPRRRYAER